jgi:hypothetical protein
MRRRVGRLEMSQQDKDIGVRLFFVTGGYEGDDAWAFLRDQRVNLRENVMVVQFLPAEDGRPLYQPMELATWSPPTAS